MHEFDDEVEQQTALLMADRNQTDDFFMAQSGDWHNATLHRLMNADADEAAAITEEVRSLFALHVKSKAEEMAVAAIQSKRQAAAEDAAYVEFQFRRAA